MRLNQQTLIKIVVGKEMLWDYLDKNKRTDKHSSGRC